MSKKSASGKIDKKSRDGKEKAVVYPSVHKTRGVEYPCFVVRGWKVGGKPQRKQFTSKRKADDFAASININLLNTGHHRELKLTTLVDDQVDQAERAIHSLGDAYTLDDAVTFFLKHHRPPEFTISITDGLKYYIDEKEGDGVREPTRKTIKLIIKAFANFTGDPLVHTVTEVEVQAYLKSLKGVDGITSAKKKTWNNHRNELASFFLWSGKKDLTTNRPWTFSNPVEGVLAHSSKRVAEQRPEAATTSPETVQELFSYLMTYKGGRLVKWFALAYFAGIRPSTDMGELAKLSDREDELINLTTGRIFLPADMTKTKDSRPIEISDNLKAWLEAYKDLPIVPVNLKNDYRYIRKRFNLQSDETRHSFISYHIALHRSIGGTAQEAGNSERMIKKHYLDHKSKEEGEMFFNIIPDEVNQKAILDTSVTAPANTKLKAI